MLRLSPVAALLAALAAVALSVAGIEPSEASEQGSGAARIVYAVSQGGSARGVDYDVCVMNADGSARRRITSGPGYDLHPRWSPGGTRILLEQRPRDGESNAGSVHVVRPDGSGRVNLTPRSETFGIDHQPEWSPDGTKIAFSRWANRGEEPYEISVMDADGSHRRNLGSGRDPAWSPDGSRIVFARAGFAGQFIRGLYVMNADGTGRSRLTETGTSPAWSPDGTKIAFSDSETPGTGPFHIYLMSPDGSARGALTDARVSDDTPSWSPNGKQVAFVRGGFFGEIYVVNADGSGERNLTRSRRSETAPSWVPTGAPTVSAKQQGCAPSLVGTQRADRLTGTRGDDALYGLGGSDRIDAKSGVDLVSAGAGADRVLIRDGRRDSASCGRGLDVVVADRRDLVARDCERVRRR